MTIKSNITVNKPSQWPEYLHMKYEISSLVSIMSSNQWMGNWYSEWISVESEKYNKQYKESCKI